MIIDCNKFISYSYSLNFNRNAKKKIIFQLLKLFHKIKTYLFYGKLIFRIQVNKKNSTIKKMNEKHPVGIGIEKKNQKKYAPPNSVL